MELETLLGQEVAEKTKHGELVPDKIIIELIEDYVRLHGAHGFVFDGFPRTIPQAEALQGILQRHRTPLDLAIWLDVSAETINDRISHRLQCQSCGFTTAENAADFRSVPSAPIATVHSCGARTMTLGPADALSEFNSKTQPLGEFLRQARRAAQDRRQSRPRRRVSPTSRV
jgi:adenylate kinase